MGCQMRIVIVEDEQLLRDSIAQTISEVVPEAVVVARCANGQEALEAIAANRPQVVMTDIRMPVMDGMELIREVSRRYPGIFTIVLSGFSDFSYAKKAIQYGVSNYLLKPVDKEELASTLHQLQLELFRAGQGEKRTARYSSGYQQIAVENTKTILFSLCLGSLLLDATDRDAVLHAEHAAAAAGWSDILNRCFPDALAWYLEDETVPNQKTICYVVDKHYAGDIESVAHALSQSLCEALGGVPVTLCGSLYPQEHGDASLMIQRMRNIIRQSLVIGQSRICWVERDECSVSQQTEPIKLRINYQLHALVGNKDVENIQKELLLLYKYMVQKSFSQNDIYQITLHILRMIEYSGIDIQSSRVAAIRQLCRSCAALELPAGMTAAIMKAYQRKSAPGFEQETLAQTLKDYIDEHYLKITTLESLTEQFNYRYEYMCRLFKKVYKISMSNYLIEKRIELAKSLMDNNDDLSITEISAIAGYEDRRYFTRLFKSCTGLTPSEYRAQQQKEG